MNGPDHEAAGLLGSTKKRKMNLSSKRHLATKPTAILNTSLVSAVSTPVASPLKLSKSITPSHDVSRLNLTNLSPILPASNPLSHNHLPADIAHLQYNDNCDVKPASPSTRVTTPTTTLKAAQTPTSAAPFSVPNSSANKTARPAIDTSMLPTAYERWSATKELQTLLQEHATMPISTFPSFEETLKPLKELPSRRAHEPVLSTQKQHSLEQLFGFDPYQTMLKDSQFPPITVDFILNWIHRNPCSPTYSSQTPPSQENPPQPRYNLTRKRKLEDIAKTSPAPNLTPTSTKLTPDASLFNQPSANPHPDFLSTPPKPVDSTRPKPPTSKLDANPLTYSKPWLRKANSSLPVAPVPPQIPTPTHIPKPPSKLSREPSSDSGFVPATPCKAPTIQPIRANLHTPPPHTTANLLINGQPKLLQSRHNSSNLGSTPSTRTPSGSGGGTPQFGDEDDAMMDACFAAMPDGFNMDLTTTTTTGVGGAGGLRKYLGTSGGEVEDVDDKRENGDVGFSAPETAQGSMGGNGNYLGPAAANNERPPTVGGVVHPFFAQRQTQPVKPVKLPNTSASLATKPWLPQGSLTAPVIPPPVLPPPAPPELLETSTAPAPVLPKPSATTSVKPWANASTSYVPPILPFKTANPPPNPTIPNSTKPWLSSAPNAPKPPTSFPPKQPAAPLSSTTTVNPGLKPWATSSSATAGVYKPVPILAYTKQPGHKPWESSRPSTSAGLPPPPVSNPQPPTSRVSTGIPASLQEAKHQPVSRPTSVTGGIVPPVPGVVAPFSGGVKPWLTSSNLGAVGNVGLKPWNNNAPAGVKPWANSAKPVPVINKVVLQGKCPVCGCISAGGVMCSDCSSFV
ncbi:hypothetical protein HDV05_007512 [Chytridiales sp. JEL 0842]|nr:hypothetical protein HDV05_007512 [Chytridiales sp. JEL 0842]